MTKQTMTENKKVFPFTLALRDLIVFYDILQLAKGPAANKTIKQVLTETRAALIENLKENNDKGKI